MSSEVNQAREALGNRLREIRRDAGLTGRDLASRAGWPGSKISKIEYGKQTPSEQDIRTWCDLGGALGAVPDLIAAVRHIEEMYGEWRRKLGTGTQRHQKARIELEKSTRLFRWHEPLLIPGILHTAEYAAAIMRQVIDFFGLPDDIEAGVSARMERQQILYRGDHRLHFILGHQALYTVVGDASVMTGQLDRLLTMTALPRVRLGILPPDPPYVAPTNQFIMYDDRFVYVEAVSAELVIAQPREIALYARAFAAIGETASYGAVATERIHTALDHFRSTSPAAE